MRKKLIVLGGILFFTVLNAQLGIGLCGTIKSSQLLTFKENNERSVPDMLQNSLSINSIPHGLAVTTTIYNQNYGKFSDCKYLHYIHTSSSHFVYEVVVISPVFMNSLDSTI